MQLAAMKTLLIATSLALSLAAFGSTEAQEPDDPPYQPFEPCTGWKEPIRAVVVTRSIWVRLIHADEIESEWHQLTLGAPGEFEIQPLDGEAWEIVRHFRSSDSH